MPSSPGRSTPIPSADTVRSPRTYALKVADDRGRRLNMSPRVIPLK